VTHCLLTKTFATLVATDEHQVAVRGFGNLTLVGESDAAFVMVQDRGRSTSTLFVARPDARTALYDGERASLEEVADDLGLRARFTEELELYVDSLVEAGLPEREQWILSRRYGLHGREPETLGQIAADLGITAERVRQLQKVALGKLQRPGVARRLKAYAN